MKKVNQILFFTIYEWEELEESDQVLIKMAVAARKNARSWVSGFAVGAAIRTDAGNLFDGCNTEDIALNGTIHAEACAHGTMMACQRTKRYDSISEIAIALDKEEIEIAIPPVRRGPQIIDVSQIVATPCGHCRTLLSQYQPKNRSTKVLALQPNGQVLVTTINDLYPLGFKIV